MKSPFFLLPYQLITLILLCAGILNNNILLQGSIQNTSQVIIPTSSSTISSSKIISYLKNNPEALKKLNSILWTLVKSGISQAATDYALYQTFQTSPTLIAHDLRPTFEDIKHTLKIDQQLYAVLGLGFIRGLIGESIKLSSRSDLLATPSNERIALEYGLQEGFLESLQHLLQSQDTLYKIPRQFVITTLYNATSAHASSKALYLATAQFQGILDMLTTLTPDFINLTVPRTHNTLIELPESIQQALNSTQQQQLEESINSHMHALFSNPAYAHTHKFLLDLGTTAFKGMLFSLALSTLAVQATDDNKPETFISPELLTALTQGALIATGNQLVTKGQKVGLPVKYIFKLLGKAISTLSLPTQPITIALDAFLDSVLDNYWKSINFSTLYEQSKSTLTRWFSRLSLQS